MIELLIGYAISSWMGVGTLYLVLLVFAFAYPRLFRVLWWMLMLPIMSLGSAPFIWLGGGFFLGWNMNTWYLSLAGGFVFGMLFCLAIDPKQSS